jgi:hypothetical protein
MTGFSTPFPGSLSGGLNSLSAPPLSSMLGGGSAPASLLALLRNRTSAVDSLPGSPAPQLPLLPHAPHNGLGPVPGIPAPAQPQQSNLMSLLGALGQLGNKPPVSPAGAGAAQVPFDWGTSTGLFGGDGPLLGVTGLFGSYGPLFNSVAGTDAASLGYGSLLGGSAATAAALPEGMSLADMLGAGLIAM